MDHVGNFDGSGQGHAEVRGERLAPDAVEAREGAQFFQGGRIARRACFDGGNHEVFRRVPGGDKLEDVRAVAGVFEELRAEGVGRELGVAFQKDAVPEGGGEDGRGGDLRAQLLLTAWRDKNQARAGADAPGDGVVSGGVAGVEGDEDFGCVFAQWGAGD